MAYEKSTVTHKTFKTSNSYTLQLIFKIMLSQSSNYFQAKEELNSASISQNSYKSIIHIYNEKLNEEMNRSLSLEQEKIHWENEYKLLCKKKESVS